MNKKARKFSREKVLNHLVEKCQDIYKLKGWENINSKFDDYESGNLAKTEAAQGIKKELEASIGVNVPGLPFGFNVAFKYKTN